MLSNTSTLNADLIEKLETALDNSLTSDIPGAAVAIISPNGNWFGASGIADLANNTPLQPNDRFEIGSITKTFVAVTLLQLVEAGQLSLEDTLAEWLPASLTSGIPNADAITIKQILNHTSGIADYTNPLFVQAATNPLVFLEEWQPEQLVELIRGAEPVFAPGASWDYSNTNFILAGLVIESVTGNTIASEIRDRILTPLNLENTFFAGEEEIPGGYINGYWDFDQNNTLDDITVTNLSWAWAAGAIISNTADLATFAAGLFQGKLLAPDTLAQMLDTVPVNSPNYDSYGLGIGTIESPNRFWWIHRGQTLGFRSNLWYSPAEDITYVELINGRSSSNLAGTLLPTFRNGLTNNGDIMNYNETIDGDISGNPASPLALELAAGDNILRATSVAGDREYVTVTIPDGLQLDSVELDSYTSADEIAFAAVQRGDVFTEPPRQTNVANLLGYSHFGTTDLGSDILDNLGRGDGAIGFTSPLPSGNYTFWLQQTGEPATYTLNFNVSASNTPSPEPVVSLQTVTGAFGIDDKVLATSLVDELVTFETGTSVLSLVLSATGDIPADGLVVTIDTDVELSDYFGRLGRIPFTPGGEILEVLYDDTGKTTEIKFRMDAPNAVINLNAADDGNVDGVRQATFSLADGDGYAVKAGSGASTVQFYDTLAQVPQPTIVPEVGFTVDQTTLVETDGTAFTLNFTLSEAPPAEGVLVYVLSPQRGVLSEFDVLNAEVAGGVFPPANFQSSGFYFKITEQTASITLSAFNDGDQEGMEELTFAIQSGPGYTIAAGSDTVKLNVLDEVNSQIQVGLTTEPAVLVEADKTVSVHKFSLSATPPAQGLTVAVVAPNLSEFDLNGIVVEGGEIARLTPTGFDLKITAKEATIKLPVADDGTAEGIETAIFTLQDGSTYQVNPAAIAGQFTIVDTADQVPSSTVVRESNDTLATAFDTRLSSLSPTFKIKSSIDYDGANSTVDATEDVDFYTFTLKAGETVTIDTDATSVDLGNFVNTGFNTVLRLFDANGEELALNNNGSAPDEVFFRTLDSYISYTAETDGTYYVAVSSSNNNAYDPNKAGSGSGNTRGSYDLAITLNPDQPAPTPLPPAGTPTADALTVTMDTVVGTFDGVLPIADNPNFDNIVVPTLVQSLAPSLVRGQSLLTFSFQTEGDIPSEGLEVFIKADSNIAEFLNANARVLLVGANTNGPIYSNTGDLIGFKLTLFEPQANATFVLQNLETPETDGPETTNFTLLPTTTYKIGGDATLPVTVYDTIEQAQAAVVTEPGSAVSLSLSNMALVESAETETTLTFNVAGEIPEDGLLVYVDSPTRLALGDLDLTKATITGGEFPPANFDASGFYFKIKENGASITFKALDEAKLPLLYTPEEAAEGLESFTYKLVDAPGYTVDTAASEVTFTIADTPNSLTRVNLTGSPAVLVESEKTVAKLNFSLSSPPSDDGVLVTIAAPEMLEFDRSGLVATGGELVSASPDNTSFTFRITELTASVEIPIADDGVQEDLETATFTLQLGAGYEINPTTSVATFKLVDTPADVPPISQETDTGAAGNDTIATANVVALSALNYSQATVNGALARRNGVDDSEDVDLYAIALKAGETIKLNVDSIAYTITGTTREQRVDTELRIFDASGEELAYNAEAPAPGEIFRSGRDAYLEFTAAANGTYYVGVAQLGNRNYNPNQQASGSGRIFPNSGINTGAYTLDFTLDASVSPIPALANDLLDLRPLTGNSRVEITNQQSDALFTNVVGFYRIEDTIGTVVDPLTGSSVKPGDTGYATAALRRSQTAGDGFSFNIKGTEAVVATLKNGVLYAPFIVSDGTVEQAISGSKDVFFDFAAANPLGLDHIKKSSNTYSFEDFRGGFDLDFNDAVFSVRTTIA